MAENDFLLFANTATNIESQASYAADPDLTAGVGSGIASSAQFNKIARQATTAMAVLAQFIQQQLPTQTVLDTGETGLAAILASLTSALETIGTANVSANLVTSTSLTVAEAGSYFNVSGGTIQTLPASNTTAGKTYGFVASGTSALTIVAGGGSFYGDSLTGSTTINLVAGNRIIVQSDGTNYRVVAASPSILGVGFLAATQTWSGANTFAANATFEQAVTVEGGFTVDGNATVEGITAFGTGGQFSINPNYAGTQLINFASGNYVQFSAGVGLQFVSSEEIQLSASSGVFTSTPPVNDSSTRVATTQFANPGSSIGTPGRILFPCGLIFQWGSGPAAANSATSIVYEKPFPNAVLMGQATWGGTAPVSVSPPTLNVHGVGSSTSQGYVYNSNGSTIDVDWFVIGY